MLDWEKFVATDLTDLSSKIEAAAQKQPTLDQFTEFLRKSVKLVDSFDVLNQAPQTVPSENTIADGKSLLQTFRLILQVALTHPEKLAQHYASFASSALAILQKKSDIEPEPGDRRFKDPLWNENALLKSLMQIYLSWKNEILTWLGEQEFNESDRLRVEFVLNQLISAFAPSNLPLNPKALKRSEKTQGMSTVKGLLNWTRDACNNQGMPKQVNENAYEVGKNLATTPGNVVYRNEVLELIQYNPQTKYVYRKPLLLIPPQINKYYIFDLKQKNSILKYLVSQGFQMFVISWRNPHTTDKEWGLETYLKAILEAVHVIQSICKTKKINLVSACAGGLTSQVLLAYLSRVNKNVINSQSLLVTALVPNNNSVLELFSTKESIALARAKASIDGYMDGKALAKTFAWLRPEELVWNYWVNNYLMGMDPPPLDVLFWDNDSTRLPTKLHSEFIFMYEQDVFRTPNKQKVFGLKLDYSQVKVNSYIAAGDEDYLMPWKGVYQTTQLYKGKHRFILSRSGHVQSILRPPNLAKTDYLSNEDLNSTPEKWLKNATSIKGTWWQDWVVWLQKESGSLKRAPTHTGNSLYSPLTPAPGHYVLQH